MNFGWDTNIQSITAGSEGKGEEQWLIKNELLVLWSIFAFIVYLECSFCVIHVTSKWYSHPWRSSQEYTLSFWVWLLMNRVASQTRRRKKKILFLTWLLICPYLAVVSLVVQFYKVFLTAESEHEMKTSIPFQFVDSWKTWVLSKRFIKYGYKRMELICISYTVRFNLHPLT